jgi:hypothetical protein
MVVNVIKKSLPIIDHAAGAFLRFGNGQWFVFKVRFLRRITQDRVHSNDFTIVVLDGLKLLEALPLYHPL